MDKENNPVYINLDAADHLIKRIDHYLYKKWPDIFLEDNLKKLKDDILNSCDSVSKKEKLIHAHIQELEGRLKSGLSYEMNMLRSQIAKLERDVADLKTKKWYQFFSSSKKELSEEP